MNNLKNIIKSKKGYTLTELLVSMVIFAVLMIMFSLITFSAIRVSNDISVRAKYRESITEVMDLIKRDVRNASTVVSCAASECVIAIDDTYVWKICPEEIASNALCKFRRAGDGTETILKKTADNIFINTVLFEKLDISGTDNAQSDVTNTTIIITVEAVPLKTLEELELAKNGEIPFDVRQIVVSTRNVGF